jgi:hypothetical protein
MKHRTTKQIAKSSAAESVSEILILADGKILAHNISPVLAGMLVELNPSDEAMQRRAVREHTFKHELPN